MTGSPKRLRLRRARGRALSMIALDRYNLNRVRWFEHIPWLGDVFFRRRIAWAQKLATLPTGSVAWLEARRALVVLGGMTARECADQLLLGTGQGL